MLTTALTYCSTDNFLSPILVCDWFIYKLLWKLDTSSKKRNENDKNTTFTDEKKKKKKNKKEKMKKIKKKN